MKKLHFGTAGTPHSTLKKSTLNGIKRVSELGLDNLEMEFVHGVRMKEELAREVKKTAEIHNVLLSAHGPYYINLTSKEQEKQEASINRILNTARIAHSAGATTFTFHTAFYQGRSKEEIYATVKKHMASIIETLKKENNPIWVRPETTGKSTQFGTVDELIQLSQELDQVMPCIDFSHLHARSNGKFNSPEEFEEILTKIEDGLGKQALENMHIHVSGIAYGEKGEKHHLILEDSDLQWRELLNALKDFGCKGLVVCESPNIEEDARMMKDYYEGL